LLYQIFAPRLFVLTELTLNAHTQSHLHFTHTLKHSLICTSRTH